MSNQNNINMNNFININNNNNQFLQTPQQQMMQQQMQQQLLASQQQMIMQQMQQQLMASQQNMQQQFIQQNQMNNNNIINEQGNNYINFQSQIQQEKMENIIHENEDKNEIEDKLDENQNEINDEEKEINDDIKENADTMINKDDINIIFRPIGKNKQSMKPIIVQCRVEDTVSYIINKYKEKSGDKSMFKNFFYEDVNLFPGNTIGESGLYDNAVIEVKYN